MPLNVTIDADVVAIVEEGFGSVYRAGICIGRGDGKVALLTYGREVVVVREEDVVTVRPYRGRPAHPTLPAPVSAIPDADQDLLVASID